MSARRPSPRVELLEGRASHSSPSAVSASSGIDFEDAPETSGRHVAVVVTPEMTATAQLVPQVGSLAPGLERAERERERRAVGSAVAANVMTSPQGAQRDGSGRRQLEALRTAPGCLRTRARRARRRCSLRRAFRAGRRRRRAARRVRPRERARVARDGLLCEQLVVQRGATRSRGDRIVEKPRSPGASATRSSRS